MAHLLCRRITSATDARRRASCVAGRIGVRRSRNRCNTQGGHRQAQSQTEEVSDHLARTPFVPQQRCRRYPSHPGCVIGQPAPSGVVRPGEYVPFRTVPSSRRTSAPAGLLPALIAHLAVFTESAASKHRSIVAPSVVRAPRPVVFVQGRSSDASPPRPPFGLGNAGRASLAMSMTALDCTGRSTSSREISPTRDLRNHSVPPTLSRSARALTARARRHIPDGLILVEED